MRSLHWVKYSSFRSLEPIQTRLYFNSTYTYTYSDTHMSVIDILEAYCIISVTVKSYIEINILK